MEETLASLFTRAFQQYSVVWLLLSTFVATLSGFVSSWLTYRFVGRREMIDRMRLKGKSEKEDRIRQEVIRWANPILNAVQDLRYRLRNVLEKNGHLALMKDYKRGVNPAWSISYDYFMHSTLFYFGRYFAWTQMLEEELNFELFESQKEKDEFFEAIRSVRESLSSFPPKYYECKGKPKDTQVFTLQQRAIGELLALDGSKGRRCMSYPEFLEKSGDKNFNQHLKPLRELLEGVNPEPNDDCRWERLKQTEKALVQLEEQCKNLLRAQVEMLPQRGFSLRHLLRQLLQPLL